VIFKIFRHLQLKDLLKNKYSIESQMDYVEKSMKGLGYSITHEAIFKYYLAFLERNEQDQKARSSSSDSNRKKRRHKVEEIEDEEEFASSLRKFTIPELAEQKMQQLNEAEEEGEIKDESRDSSSRKKKGKSKKKKRSSSSDSD
jgi:hypothetical protein